MEGLKNTIANINLEGVSAGTVVRLVMMIIAGVVYVLEVFGIVPPEINENAIYSIVIAAFGVITFLQSYWKNNSWTDAAQKADELMKAKKAESATATETTAD